MGSLGDQKLGLVVFNTITQEEAQICVEFFKDMYQKCFCFFFNLFLLEY